MANASGMNKAKIARRVIEVLEFFDEEHREATVMDIVRRYKRPQSSTSELLTSLVDLGLLYKDPYSRCYTLTPRAAMLGSHSQPDIVRDGRLTALVDRLVAQTGLGVAVFGMVGLNGQLFSWRSGGRRVATARPEGFGGGLQDRLTGSAVGWLLLSSVAQPRRDGMIRRLNAEAPESAKFAFPEMAAKVESCQARAYAVGPAGYGTDAHVAAVLLPNQPEGHPMAIGFVHHASDQIDSSALIQALQYGVQRCSEQAPSIATVQSLPSAA